MIWGNTVIFTLDWWVNYHLMLGETMKWKRRGKRLFLIWRRYQNSRFICKIREEISKNQKTSKRWKLRYPLLSLASRSHWYSTKIFQSTGGTSLSLKKPKKDQMGFCTSLGTFTLILGIKRSNQRIVWQMSLWKSRRCFWKCVTIFINSLKLTDNTW